jgi:hypothetical protein
MNLESLLIRISSINKKYEEIAKISGENFNIFNLLNLSDNEISHSKIIATLLNPNGMHGKGNRFLKLFIDCIGIKDFSIDGVIVENEKYIGPISEDCSEGGRIDIILTNNQSKQTIIIENKIYAGDRRKQLYRYHKYNPKAYLFYLTLYGDDPSEISLGESKEIEVKKISYKENVLKWLELCKKESVDNPLLRETLTQYIVLIKKLTGQARSQEMQKEYMDAILKDADNVSAAFIILQNISINEIKRQILEEKFIPSLKELVCKLEMDIMDINISKDSYWCFSFSKEEWKPFKIVFGFENNSLQNLFYAIGKVDCIDFEKKIVDYLRQLKNYKHSEVWQLFQFMDKYRDNEFFINICSNNSDVINDIKEKIEEIEGIIINCKKQG